MHVHQMSCVRWQSHGLSASTLFAFSENQSSSLRISIPCERMLFAWCITCTIAKEDGI